MNWTRKQVLTICIVAMASFLGTFLISSINIALPAIGREFGLKTVDLSWVVTSFLLASAMFLLPVGKLGDVAGNSRLYKVGLLLFTLSSFLCGIAQTGNWLILFRFLQGIGAALTSTTGQALLVSSFEPKHRGRVLGISVSAVYLGLAFGPFIGGVLTQFVGWRSIFIFSALFGFLAVLFAFRSIERDDITDFEFRSVDFKGIILYVIGLVAMVYGSGHITTVVGSVALILGLGVLVLFWRVETNANNPILDTNLFRKNRLFGYSSLAALINYTATSAIVFFLSLYLQKVQGLSPRDAGIILISQPIVMALFSPLVGRWSDSVEPRYFATIGMAMCSVGLVAFAFLNQLTASAMVVAILVWVGIGFALFSSPNMNVIMSSVDKTQLGMASGTAASMRVIGQMVSMIVVGAFFSTFFGNTIIESVSSQEFLSAMKWGFLTFAALSLIGIYFSYNRKEIS